MHDWQSIITGRFIKKSEAFDLKLKLQEIENLMRLKA
jgi:hypothetical protein